MFWDWLHAVHAITSPSHAWAAGQQAIPRMFLPQIFGCSYVEDTRVAEKWSSMCMPGLLTCE